MYMNRENLFQGMFMNAIYSLMEMTRHKYWQYPFTMLFPSYNFGTQIPEKRKLSKKCNAATFAMNYSMLSNMIPDKQIKW